jgi:transposase-like protein
MIYNISYSPQFNPIEYVNNELKRQIKTENIKNESELRIFMKGFIKENNKKRYMGYFEKAYKLMGI